MPAERKDEGREARPGFPRTVVRSFRVNEVGVGGEEKNDCGGRPQETASQLGGVESGGHGPLPRLTGGGEPRIAGPERGQLSQIKSRPPPALLYRRGGVAHIPLRPPKWHFCLQLAHIHAGSNCKWKSISVQVRGLAALPPLRLHLILTTS
ncbi:hypothetical protein DFH09DRAFT_1078257 [Mycena vulgaris]|nr:hypothetical protein DFH09DRAFT_1078257 [Mycena vulgaris]